MSSLLIQNATIVNEGRTFKGDLLIKDELITEVGYIDPERIPAGIKIIDAQGLLLLPGIIDDQVHFREPGLTHKGDILSESRAAVAGGVTSFMDMPNTIPQTISIDLLNEKYKTGAENSLINYSFYIGGTNTNLNDLLNADPESVCGIKLFLGSSTGNMLVDNETVLKEIFSKSSLLIACHCEDEPTIRKNAEIYRQNYGEDVPVKFHPLIRNREACYITSSYAVRLAREFNSRLHILHLSTADELKLFDNGLSLAEKRITGEVCIHHLWFEEADYERLGASIKWNPSIKTKYDRDALIKGVNNDLIDIIATDHAPHTIAEKSLTYFKSPSGGPLIQHSLAVMMEMYHQGLFSLEKIVEKMCHNPAILYRIKDRGFIREGYKADICLVDPNSSWTVSRDNLLYKCGWSPFEGTTFRSKVIMTIVNGTIVYDDGLINENYRGQRLMFHQK
jgi:dihydroorotase